MKNTIKLSELIYLNEAAKALKQKDIMIKGWTLIGIDNIENYVTCVTLDSNLWESSLVLHEYIFSARELSAFLKTVTTENEFEIIQAVLSNTIVISNTMAFVNFIKDKKYIYIADKKCEYITDLSPMKSSLIPSTAIINGNIRQMNYLCEPEETEITYDLAKLFSIRKQDGCIYYRHKNKYFITLFSGILPLNKGDRIYLTIYDHCTTFVAKFRIVKKRFIVNIYLRYLSM